MVDVTQMAGAVPVTMAEWGADALVCSGYKWPSAPGGVALLAVAEDLAAAIPPMVGWKGSPAPFDFRPQELSLAPGARRFELSTMSYSAAVGLLASIKLLTGIGLTSIQQHAGRLAAELVEQTAPLGWTPYRALADRSASGHIVSLRHRAAVAGEVQAALAREHRIHTSSRGNGIRVSLHTYNCTDDAPAASAATANSMPGMDGWIRLAHLSPNTPAVDVYLYSFGNPRARLVLRHVAYGTVSSYMKVAPGEYSVAMRKPGASPASQPVLSTTVHVVADHAYTVAGLGPASGVRLQVLQDRIMTPKGKILIRVIQASLRQHLVTVTAGAQVLARNLAFAQLTRYRVANPGRWTFRATGASEHTSRMVAVTLTDGTAVTGAPPVAAPGRTQPVRQRPQRPGRPQRERSVS